MVQYVEGVDAERDEAAAPQVEVLVQTGVEVVVAGAGPLADRGVAEGAEPGSRERRRVEPVIPIRAAVERILSADDIRPLERETAVLERTTRAPALRGGTRQTAAHREDRADVPAAAQRLRQAR